MDNLLGKIICGYRIRSEIGEGGMGKVYLAESAFLTEYKQQVAVKTLTPANERQAVLLRELFLREANIQVQLKHPHIVSVIQFAIEQIDNQDRHFLILEYIPGYFIKNRRVSNVAELIRYETGPIPHQRALRLFVQSLDALGYAHNFKYRWEGEERVGIVHRDVKPANLLLMDGNTIKVGDFGIVKVQQRQGSVTQRLTPGTSSYMPPEAILGPQHFGQAELDARSDVYSLGVTLYEMLCGRLPFSPDENTNPDVSMRRKQVEETPLPPSHVYPRIPRQLDELVLRAMEKHPGKRYQSTAEFKQAILALDRSLELGLAAEPADPHSGVETRSFAAGTTVMGGATAPGAAATTATGHTNASAPTVRGFATAAAQPAESQVSSSWTKYLIIGALLAVVVAAAGALVLPKILSRTPVSTATVAGPEKAAPPSAPPGMIFILGGSYLMGRNLTPAEADVAVENNGRREKIFVYDYPAHEVAVKPFLLDQTELPNRAYAEFLRALNRPIPQGWDTFDPPAGAEDLPVVNVTYRDAVDYCEWRTQKRKDGLSYRLPTEEEWEFAARGLEAGKSGKSMNLYPWGEEWDVKHANTLEARLNHAQIVTANASGASPFGVLNLAGNVYEWTSTDFKHYPGSDRQTPQEAGYQGTYQVVRGGAFTYPKEYALTTTRMWAKPVSSGPKLGFRCAADAQR